MSTGCFLFHDSTPGTGGTCLAASRVSLYAVVHNGVTPSVLPSTLPVSPSSLSFIHLILPSHSSTLFFPLMRPPYSSLSCIHLILPSHSSTFRCACARYHSPSCLRCLQCLRSHPSPPLAPIAHRPLPLRLPLPPSHPPPSPSLKLSLPLHLARP